MRYAVIREGIVENIIVWDGQELLCGYAGADFIRSETAAIGDRYDCGQFISTVLENAEDVGGG